MEIFGDSSMLTTGRDHNFLIIILHCCYDDPESNKLSSDAFCFIFWQIS